MSPAENKEMNWGSRATNLAIAWNQNAKSQFWVKRTDAIEIVVRLYILLYCTDIFGLE